MVFSKEHCIFVSASSGRTGYYPNTDSNISSVHYAISVSHDEPEILSRLILDFARSNDFEYHQYQIYADDIDSQPVDDLKKNIIGEKALKYVVVVAGNKINKVDTLNVLKAKWPDGYLLDTFPKNIYFMMGPDNYDGNYHVFFIHESCKESFWRILIKLCDEFSLVLKYDPRDKAYLE